MNRRYVFKIVLPATLAVVFSATAESSHAGLLDWLFPGRRARRTSYLVTQYPVGCNNTSACGMCAPQQPQTSGFTPQTTYRTVWAPVPVTTYRAGAGAMQPCTSYTWQARRVPYVSFQPALGQVSPCGSYGVGGCAAGACSSGTCGTGFSYRPTATTAGYAMSSSATPWVSTDVMGATYEQPTTLGYANGNAFSPDAGCRSCGAATSGPQPMPYTDTPALHSGGSASGLADSPAGASAWQTVPPTDGSAGAGGAASERPRLQSETPSNPSPPTTGNDTPESKGAANPPPVFQTPQYIPTMEARSGDAYAAYRSEISPGHPADQDPSLPASDPGNSPPPSWLRPIPDLERDLPAWRDHEPPPLSGPPDRTASTDRWQATPISWEPPHDERPVARGPTGNVSADFWDQSGWTSAAADE